MHLNKELQQKLEYAWMDQSFGIYWASDKLSEYAYAAFKGMIVEIENYSQKIDSLKLFMQWKNQTSILKEIPIFREHIELPEILNELSQDLKINKIHIELKSNSNRYYRLLFIGEEGKYSIDIHSLIIDKSLPNTIDNITTIYFQQIDVQHYKLTCQFTQHNLSHKTKLFEIEFTNLEIT